MARVIGIPFVFKYLTGRLRVDDVERKMEQLLGAKCAAIYTSYASIGADVDKPIRCGRRITRTLSALDG